MNQTSLLFKVFQGNAQKLPVSYLDQSMSVWGVAQDGDVNDDWSDDEVHIPMAPAAPTLVMIFEDTVVGALMDMLGDILVNTPQIYELYWDGKAIYQMADIGGKAWLYIEFHTTDEDEWPASVIGAIFPLEDNTIAMVLLAVPQTVEEVTREGPLTHSEQIRDLLDVDQLPRTTIERQTWFM